MNSNKWAVLVAAGLMTVSFTCAAGQFKLVNDSATSGVVSEDNGSGMSGTEAPAAMSGDSNASGADSAGTSGNQSDDSSSSASDSGSDSGSADTATGDDDY